MIVLVNGKKYNKEPLRGTVPEPGEWIGEREGRRVYNVLCKDGTDLIARNVRRPSLIEAISLVGLDNRYCLITPLE